MAGAMAIGVVLTGDKRGGDRDCRSSAVTGLSSPTT